MPDAYEAAAVVIPAHNERAKLPGSLRAVLTAALCAPLPVTIVVVLDDTDDGSDELAGEYGPDVHFISVDVHNVGTARAVGFGYAALTVERRRPSAGLPPPTPIAESTRTGWYINWGKAQTWFWAWYASTTGATTLPTSPTATCASYRRGGRIDGDHDHIHGANMGFSARAYWRVGGFRTLASGEDVDLVERFEAAGYRIHRDTELSVITSARTQARAPHGFAHHLRQLGRTAAGDCA